MRVNGWRSSRCCAWGEVGCVQGRQKRLRPRRGLRLGCAKIPLPLWEREGAAKPRKGEGEAQAISLVSPPHPSHSLALAGPFPLPQGERENLTSPRAPF